MSHSAYNVTQVEGLGMSAYRKKKPKVLYLDYVDKLRRIMSILPVGERDMPIVKLGNKTLTWKQTYRKAATGGPEGRKVINKMHKMGLL